MRKNKNNLRKFEAENSSNWFLIKKTCTSIFLKAEICQKFKNIWKICPASILSKKIKTFI